MITSFGYRLDRDNFPLELEEGFINIIRKYCTKVDLAPPKNGHTKYFVETSNGVRICAEFSDKNNVRYKKSHLAGLVEINHPKCSETFCSIVNDLAELKHEGF